MMHACPDVSVGQPDCVSPTFTPPVVPPPVNVPTDDGDAEKRIWQFVNGLLHVFGLFPLGTALLLKFRAVATIATDWLADRLVEPGGGFSGSIAAMLLTVTMPPLFCSE